MTKEELFPKGHFPLRARKTLLHSGGLKQVVEVYYQKPPFVLDKKQDLGVYASIVSHNGTDTFSTALLSQLRWDKGLGGSLSCEKEYLESGGDFAEKTEDEMYQREKEFLERLGIAVEKIAEEAESQLETSSFGWESF